MYITTFRSDEMAENILKLLAKQNPQSSV